MVNKYKLANPDIIGNFNLIAEEKNSSDAANTFYSRMTETFNNSLPSFHFTFRKGDSEKLYHYKVEERKNKEGQINFIIKQSDVSTLEMEQKFINKLKENTIDLHGGNSEESNKKHKNKKEKSNSKKSSEEESSSSSSSYEEKHSKKHSKKRSKHKKKKKKHYDSSSSDSSFDSLNLYTDNINKYVSRQIRLETYPLYWRYYPQLYDISRVFLPSFISDTFPLLEIVYL